MSPYTDTVKLEVVCPDERVDVLAGAIGESGRRGDGTVFVLPVHRSIDIRTYADATED